MTSIITTGRILAGGVNISPNTNGLPGVGAAEKMVGALLTYGTIACIAGVIISAIVWAIGGNSSNPQMSHRGKSGVLVAFAAAIVVGGALTLVSFFSGIGATF